MAGNHPFTGADSNAPKAEVMLHEGRCRSAFVGSRSRLVAVATLLVAPALAQRGDSFNTPLRPAAEQRALFRVPPGFEVQLVATEPDLQKPFNLAFDASGRVWVTGSVLYPWPARQDALGQPIASFDKNWDDNAIAFRAAATPPTPSEHGRDTVRVLSDFGPDGRARKITTFADGLNIPIGILPLPRPAAARGDTALVFSIPAIWRLTDTDGDGRADLREKLYDGFGFKDTHGMSSSYWLWFDGWVYGTHGFSNVSEIRDASGKVTKLQSGNTYRFRPDGSRFELFTRGQTNPFGLAFDSRGDVYTADSHSKPVYLLVPGGNYEGLGREHDGLGFAPPITLDDHGSTAIAGITHYSAAHFPAEFRNNLFNGNPVTRRINRARLDWRGSTPQATRQPDFLTSDDPAFRPVQVKLGPDGALWIADFYNPIIGHYEVPLTHPARDRVHGRIWRVVWRGLDNTVSAPTMPDLTRQNSAALATRLADPNLVVRTLAASELLARADAHSVVPVLKAVAARLIAGTDEGADETAALPLLMLLERLGQGDDTLLRRALSRPDSGVAAAALRVIAASPRLLDGAESLFTSLLAAPAPEYSARLAAEIFQRHPQPWQPALILAVLAKAPASDVELVYALRVALKTHALTVDSATLAEWAAPNAATAERVAEVGLAVPTAGSAEFLLGYLEQTSFKAPRAGEFARHAAIHLPVGKFESVTRLFEAFAQTSASHRAAFAEGLAVVAAKPNRTLPDELTVWMRKELAAAAQGKDVPTAYRALVALKELQFAEKPAVLRHVALTRTYPERNRTAALRALAPNTPETDSVLGEIIVGTDSNALRRTAAELLGTESPSAAARLALTRGFSSASADLALALATALAKSEAGASELLELVAAGRVRPALLRHRYVAAALEKRAPSLRERASALTQALPPEDARLDALIAQRLAAANTAKADRANGATVFATHCASCHKISNTGASLGPSLDGLGSRGLPRLVEDILDPSRNVDPAFRVATVALRNGQTKTGMNLREESDRVLLADPATGNEEAIRRVDIAEVTPSAVSPMPAIFEMALPEQHFFDLLHFLRQPAP